MNLDSTALAYQSGFGNEFSSEALPGALPVGQNSPQKAPYGLYAELLSGTAFTMARSEARRTWLYRITPSAKHPPFRRLERHAPLRLPDLGPIGSNGLANPRDFLTPVARYEDSRQPLQLVQKYLGELWACELDHSPLDVVAWHGNNVPYKYDLRRFNTIGTVSFDHPDPSIFTVLTSPTSVPGLANIDFVIFPPRWMVAENTFRPPWFHRNLMNEFMGLIQGAYDAKAGGFVPGGASLHSCMSAHGPDAESCDKAIAADLKPHRIDQTMAFMFETSQVLRPSRAALETPALQNDYDACWASLVSTFNPQRR